MRTYPLHIDGRDYDGERWTYVVDAEAMLREPRRAFRAKRSLELGREVEPEDLELVAARCASGGEEDNLRALEAAARAARELRHLSIEDRRQLGLDVHRELESKVDELVSVLVEEGHPRRLAEWEAHVLLVGSSPETLGFVFDQMDQRFSADGRELRLTRKPDGVVCVNPPQNAASNAAMAMMALIAGNALVVRAPKTSPLSVMYLCREIGLPVVRRHGLPDGTINIVSGYSKRIVRQWLRSPLVDDIIYFGDSTAGLRFGEEAVAQGKKPILELSGNDGFLVWRDADLEAAADALTECFYGSSQICMVPKQAVLHPAIEEEFTELFVSRARAIRPGYPADPDVVLSPVLKMDKFFDFLGEAEQAGCRKLCGGERVDVDGERALDGAFIEPTVVAVDGLEHARELRCVREETFFPLMPLVTAEPADDAILLDRLLDWFNANPYGLRNSLWAADEAVVERFSTGLVNGGLLKVNDSHVGSVPYLATHGGTGRTGGPFGELNYAVFRTSHLQGISYGTGTNGGALRGAAALTAAGP